MKIQANGKSFYTVANCIHDYLMYKNEIKSIRTTSSTCEVHILPKLGNQFCADLKTQDIRNWMNELARQPAMLRTMDSAPMRNLRKINDPRARRNTANRIWAVLRASLNHGFMEGKIQTNVEWLRVKPFEHTNVIKDRFLSLEECTKIIAVCDVDFKPMVRAALFLGARYSELCRLRCEDFDRSSRSIFIKVSKSGKSRYIPLSSEGQKFFEETVTGRPDNAIMFLRPDNECWKASNSQGPLNRACDKLGIKRFGFHC